MSRIEPARTDAHLREAYRFWYDVYVKEMGRHQHDPLTDHSARLLIDPIAPYGNLLLARDAEGRVVGTLMSTWTTEPAVEKYVALYQLDALNARQRAHSTVTTKLMVAPEYRCSRLGMLLARESYRWGLANGVHYDFIDCNDHLVSFFEKLGYRPHLGEIHHQVYGRVNSMYLAVNDEVHLFNQRSPFYRPLAQHQEASRVYA